jgi:MbtH protein
MTIMFSDESQDFDVVVNVEEQYSIWPSGRELSHIDTVWTDITPLSARQ